MPALKDLSGQRFGKLTVLKYAGSVKGISSWLCRCDCGVEKTILSGNLQRNTVSCGCHRKEAARKAQFRHGRSGTPIYYVWEAMKARCHNPKNKDYKNYGARGVFVCEEWQSDFQSFYAHVSNLPHFGEPGRSLDRINNDKNYEPGNVRWATKGEQVNNRRPRKRGLSAD